MWIIEQCLSDKPSKWFRIWDSEFADEVEKRGPLFCAEYLQRCVENEPFMHRKDGRTAQFRMRFVIAVTV